MVASRVRRTPPTTLAAALVAARARAGLGQRETARRAELSAGYLANLEAGRRCPSSVAVEALASVLPFTEGEREQLDAAAVTDAGRCNPLRRAAGRQAATP
ncbi:helix-turn-helix domain-containing protein [Streptomyces sp. NPDC088736]|uniref:helix-turn-helix domain-containing protein n=1 Tax=Streptomyces sp. NPDC088736 TaxID=3365881 RepID=UPI0038116CE6